MQLFLATCSSIEMAKTPSKKTAKSAKAAGGKKRKASRHESYNIYVYKVRGGATVATFG